MDKLFVFDLDDTLIDNVHDYAKPILNACGLIIQTLGSRAPHVSKLIAIEQEIDKHRIKEINPDTNKPYLYSMERFPSSLVETYREICQPARITPKPEIEEELYNIGLQAFNEDQYVKNTKPHTLSTLDFLREQGDTLMLCSKGDKRVQGKKLSALKSEGIDHFSKIIVVDDKTPDNFKKLSKGFTRCQRYSIGNSYTSDIVPALEAGFKGIYIPVETWETVGKMEEIHAEIDKEECFVFRSLKSIQTQYEKL